MAPSITSGFSPVRDQSSPPRPAVVPISSSAHDPLPSATAEVAVDLPVAIADRWAARGHVAGADERGPGHDDRGEEGAGQQCPSHKTMSTAAGQLDEQVTRETVLSAYGQVRTIVFGVFAVLVALDSVLFETYLGAD